MLGTFHLNALFEILNKIHFIYEPKNLWQFVLEEACKSLQAEAGTYFNLSADEKELHVGATYGIPMERLAQTPFRVGTGISGWVAQYYQPALVNDVRQDHRFNNQTDVVTGFKTKSILCVPIFSNKKHYGVLEIFNRKTGPFGPPDQEFMVLLGRQAAVAYQNLLLLAEVLQKEVLLESLLQSLSGGLMAMDEQERLTILNPASTVLLHLGPEAARGLPAATALKEHPQIMDILRKTFQSKVTVSRQELLARIAGHEQRIGYSTILIADHSKNVLGAGIIFQKL